MISRGLFGWSPPHIQPLTPVSEVSEPPESPSPYLDNGPEALQVEDDGGVEEAEEMEPPPAAVPFLRLFACADGLDCILMIVGSLAAAAHGAALVVYLHFFGKIINMLSLHRPPGSPEELFHEFTKHALHIMYIAAAVFAAGWIGLVLDSYWRETDSSH